MNATLFPFLTDARDYRRPALQRDLIAGLTVAVFAVPQAMAYAMLAGVAPVYGLYAAVVMSIVAALWGSSPYVNTGPTNSAALLTAAALLPFAQLGNPLQIAVTLCLLVGIIRLAMGVARLGTLLDFVPESAFLGFTVGAGLLIALGQLHHLLGVAPPESTWFPARLIETFGHRGDLHLPALVIGLAVLTAMLTLNDRFRAFPVALAVITLAGLAAWLLHDDAPVRIVRDVAVIPAGLPPLSRPSLDPEIIRLLAPSALAIAAVGLIEAASIGQSLALRHGQRLDLNQEFIGQGLSQITSAFFSGIPGSGSFSRSILIESSGAVTRFANVFFGVATLAALFLIPRLLEWIPITALSGLLIYIGIRLVDLRRIRRVIATSRSDTVMMVLTFAVTVGYRVEYGIFAGILGAALVHLHRSRELNLVEYVPTESGRIAERPYGSTCSHPPSAVVAIGITGELFYGVSSALRRELNDILKQQRPRHLVLRMRRARSIDYSCWSVLFDLAERMDKEQCRLYLCGIRDDYEPIIRQAGAGGVLPAERLFPATEAPFEAFDRCMTMLAPSLPDDDPVAVAWRNRSLAQEPLHAG